jgi:hypothetical protein
MVFKGVNILPRGLYFNFAVALKKVISKKPKNQRILLIFDKIARFRSYIGKKEKR